MSAGEPIESEIADDLSRKHEGSEGSGASVQLFSHLQAELQLVKTSATTIYVQGENPGSIWIRESGNLFEQQMAPNEVCLIPEGWSGELGFRCPNDFMNVQLNAAFLETVLREEVAGAHLEFPLHRGIEDPQILNICRALEHEIRNGNVSGQLFKDSLTTALAARLASFYAVNRVTVPEFRGKLPHHYVRQAIDFMHANLDQAVRLEDIAKAVHMSTYHFARLFRQSVGAAPHQYFVNLRIERAKTLLKDFSKSVSTIALEVGYSSHSHFASAFRKATGYTPKRYRQLL